MKPAFNSARLVRSLARGAVEWLYNPRTHRHILRSRTGIEYAVRPTVTGTVQLIKL